MEHVPGGDENMEDVPTVIKAAGVIRADERNVYT